jgi:glycosyltransferase involved in cell wall biosynthesis
LPVIANQADGTLEAIRDGETGYLCLPGNTVQMAERCTHLIEHPQERLEMGQKGRAFAIKEFDLQRMIAQIENLYEELLLNY